MSEKQQPLLSAAQLRAVRHIRGPALVVAGPGSGKTTVIIQRILYLIQKAGIPPGQILVITYTKAAAQEMQQRFQKVWRSADQNQTLSVHFGTFHSICYHILQQSGKIRSNSLIKESEKRKLMEILMKNQGMDELCSYDMISMILNRISYEKNHYGEEQILDPRIPAENYQKLCREYDCYLKAEGFIDFEDMILQCFLLLQQERDIRESYQNLFSYILVDEFQDINRIQFEILKLLAFPKNNLFAVGDDDQAIYGFRGAAPGIMKLFQAEYPKHVFLMLTENYRSGEQIVRLASCMIGRGTQRLEKQFVPVRTGGEIIVNCYQTWNDQEKGILTELSVLNTKQREQTAIIVRNNLQVMQYGHILKTAGVITAGKYADDNDLLQSFVLQDVLAFWDFLYEGRKRSDFLQFMNKPNHFFSRMALPEEKVTREHMLAYYRQNKEMQHTVKTYFTQLEIAGRSSPALSLGMFRKVIGYERYLKEKAEDGRKFQLWIKQLEQLEKLLCQLPPNIRNSKQLRALLEQQPDAPRIYRDGIHIMTMHGAKGLEFDRVFLPDINEGIIPGRQCLTPESLEEERRLLYVAITRAKNHLYLSYTEERGRNLSRYLEGLVIPRSHR